MQSRVRFTAMVLPNFARAMIANVVMLLAVSSAFAQRTQLPPVRTGDSVEVNVLRKWYPADVLEFHESGHATVRYQWGGRDYTEKKSLADIRFPNDEGAWMVWSDASGKFRVEARYLSQNATHVTLRKADGTDISVPIDRLNKTLQVQLAKYSSDVKKLHDESPVRVGDSIEVKSAWTWYPAKVLKILPTGAVVSYEYGPQKMEADFKYEDMRYPNGEGPWREWADSTGKHKITARYLTHDETHVELLSEAGSQIRLERTKLSAKLQAELKAATLYTRRPEEVEFALAGNEGKATSSWMNFGKGIASFRREDLQFATVAIPQFSEGGFEFFVGQSSRISMVEPIGGERQLIAIGVHEPGTDAASPTTIYWASQSERKALAGPKFFADEIILAYSAEQQRLLTAEVRGTWGTPVRFCSYRLAPGGSSAKPELKWSVPKASFASASNDSRVAFLNDDRLLIGYGGSVGLWNLATRRMEYVLPSSNNEMNLSPDQKYFVTNQFSHAVIVETETGKPVASIRNSDHGSFSRDGKYLFAGIHWGLYAYDLQDGGEPIHLMSHSMHSRNLFSGFSRVADGWLSNGEKLWDLNRGILAWTYSGAAKELSMAYSTAIDDKLLAIGTRGGDETTSVLIGIAKIPHSPVLAAVETVTDEELYVLRRGVEVRLDPAISDSRMISGIKRAAEERGWVFDEGSEILITASAKLGPSVTKTYERSRFGMSRSGGDFRETVTTTPWIQLVEVKQGPRQLWATAQGGVPSMVMMAEDSSLQAELSKTSEPRYDMFDQFSFPEKVIAPKYAAGLGTSLITPGGFVDIPVE